MIGPEKIVITGPGMPLVGTFNKAVAEWAADLMIMACQDKGNWEPVLPKEIGEAMERREDKEGFVWLHAMIRSPDFDRLQEDGFITGLDEGRQGALSFTEKGMAALEDSGWVARTPTEQAAYLAAKEMRAAL